MKAVAALLLSAIAGTGLATVRYGAPPPDFRVPGRNGVTALSELRGKPVVINFWASWCPPCTDELPYFQRLKQVYGNRLRMITISNEAPGVAREYLARKQYDLPVVEDPDSRIFSKYSVPPIPDTIVLDAQGDVTYVSVGGLSWRELRAAVNKVAGASP